MSQHIQEQYRAQPDEVLLRAVGQQNIDAYEALYDRHSRVMYGLILRIVGDAAVADEVLQEVFWQIWQSAVQYTGTGAAKGWLLRVAHNRSIDTVRRRRARPQVAPNVDVAAAADQHQHPHQSAEVVAEHRQQREDVLQALAEMPNEQRICFEKIYFEGLTQREVAAEIGIPVGTVKSRMRIGIDKLERFLRSRGYP